MKPDKTIIVHVNYIAAVKPYKSEVEPTTTVGAIKTSALSAFGLIESSTKVYKLFHNKTELSNLDQTVGELADPARSVVLKLEEVLVQGI